MSAEIAPGPQFLEGQVGQVGQELRLANLVDPAAFELAGVLVGGGWIGSDRVRRVWRPQVEVTGRPKQGLDTG